MGVSVHKALDMQRFEEKKINTDFIAYMASVKNGWNSDIKAIQYDICDSVANYYNRTLIFRVLQLILVYYWREYKKCVVCV